MMRLFLSIALLPILADAARATIPCPDATIECRAKFVKDNLPAPHRPDLDEGPDSDRPAYDQIVAAIKNASELEASEKELRTKLQAYQDAGAVTHNPADRRFWTADNWKNKDSEFAAIVATKKEIETTRRKKFEAYNDAIAKTIELYELTPQLSEPLNNSDSAIPGVPTRPWSPHYTEDEIWDKNTKQFRRFNEAEKRDQWAKRGFDIDPRVTEVPEYYVSSTSFEDARIGIFQGAFASPDILASKIFHETAHWLDHNALGRIASPYGRAQSEIIAYTDEAAVATDSFNASPDQLTILTNGLVYYRKKLQRASNDLHAPDPEGFLPATSGKSGATLSSDPQGAEDINDSVNQAIARTRDKIQIARINAAADAYLLTRLSEIALRACRDSGDITQKELNGLPRPNDELFYLHSDVPAKHTDCGQRMISGMGMTLASGQSLDAQVVRNKYVFYATPSIEPPPPTAMPAINHSDDLYALATGVCLDPASMTPQRFATLYNTARTVRVSDCHGFLPRNASPCAQSVFNRLCEDPSALATLTRGDLFRLAGARPPEEIQPTPPPPPPQQSGPTPNIPDRPEKRNPCFVVDGVRACEQ